MTNKEAQKQIEDIIRFSSYAKVTNNALRMASDYLEKFSWVPVSEMLPEKDGDYLVTVQASKVCVFIAVAGYANDLTTVDDMVFSKNDSGWVEFDDELGWERLSGVTAWMPLPEPYRGEEQ